LISLTAENSKTMGEEVPEKLMAGSSINEF